MTDKAIDHFERFAAGYEAERRRVIPGYDTFYGQAVAALSLAGREIRSVLDLGSGTGLLARAAARVAARRRVCRRGLRLEGPQVRGYRRAARGLTPQRCSLGGQQTSGRSL